MAELADAQDLKSCGTYLPYRFDSGRRHELWETLYSIEYKVFLRPIFIYLLSELIQHKVDVGSYHHPGDNQEYEVWSN